MKKNGAKKIIRTCIYIIMFYTVITVILFLIRGNCFSAYRYYKDIQMYIIYRGNNYSEIIEEEKILNLDKEVAGEWYNRNEIVLNAPIKFPYIEYWIPEVICERLDYTKDFKYIVVYGPSGEDRFFQKVEE